MTNVKFVACSALLIILMLSAYLFLQNYVYPQTIGKPFGSILFFGSFTVVFVVVIAIAYFLLRLVLTSFSRKYYCSCSDIVFILSCCSFSAFGTGLPLFER